MCSFKSFTGEKSFPGYNVSMMSDVLKSDVLAELHAASADTISLCTTLEDLLSDLPAVSALLSLTRVLFVSCRCDRKWHKST